MANYLTIGGNGLDDLVAIDSISCTHGRTDVTNQPSPGTFKCTFELNYGQSLVSPIQVNDGIVWKIYDSNGTDNKTTIYTGQVSDISINLKWYNGNGIFVYNITGVDILARFGNKTYSSAIAKQYDGTRISTIVGHYGGSTTDIETPGAYELAAVTATPGANALQLCQDAANSAMGVLYVNPQTGNIKYQSYLSRKANPEIALTTDDVIASDFMLATSTNTVANQVSLTYGSSGASSTVYDDTASQATYGVRSGIRNTTLHNVTDANSQAQTLLASRANPAFNLSSLTINSATISDSLRTDIANIEVGTWISILNLPTDELESFEGIVEGYTWTTARGQDMIQINLSNAIQMYPYTLWTDLNGSDTWNTYATATTKWSQIT
jgi:hypothetical protein